MDSTLFDRDVYVWLAKLGMTSLYFTIREAGVKTVRDVLFLTERDFADIVGSGKVAKRLRRGAIQEAVLPPDLRDTCVPLALQSGHLVAHTFSFLTAQDVANGMATCRFFTTALRRGSDWVFWNTTRADVPKLTAFLRQFERLRGLKATTLGRGGIGILSKTIRSLACGGAWTLRRLSLQGLAMGDDGFKVLCGDAVDTGGLELLEVLHLDHNKLTMASARRLGKALYAAKLPHLHTISLAFNPVGDAGVAALVKSAASATMPPPLQSLGFAATLMTGTGVAAVEAALRTKSLPRLHTLDMRWNTGIKAAGGARIVRMLACRPAPLSNLSVRGHGAMDADTVRRIHEAA